MNPRTFPGPWHVEASDGAFIVRDAKGFPVTYVYWKAQKAMRDRYFSRFKRVVILACQSLVHSAKSLV
jgi:hypothetical protein